VRKAQELASLHAGVPPLSALWSGGNCVEIGTFQMHAILSLAIESGNWPYKLEVLEVLLGLHAVRAVPAARAVRGGVPTVSKSMKRCS